MGEHTFTLLFALFYALAYCSSHQGGNSSTQLSFCNIPGCGSHVNNVFCNDVLLFSGGPITNCTGPPPHNNVCQHKGLAFVSADPDSRCDFEGKDGHIESDICTDHSSICASLTENSSIFPTSSANTSSPDNVPTRKHYGSIVGVCILLLIILIAVLAGIYCRHSQQQQARNSSENSAAAVPQDSEIRE